MFLTLPHFYHVRRNRPCSPLFSAIGKDTGKRCHDERGGLNLDGFCCLTGIFFARILPDLCGNFISGNWLLSRMRRKIAGVRLGYINLG